MPGEAVASPFFNAHAKAYAASASHARGADLEALLAALTLQPGEAAADVATGTGHTALALAAAGLTVVGVDPTPAMLQEARRLAAEQGLSSRVRWERAEVDALPLPQGAFNVVTCRRAFHHFPNPTGALHAMARLLAAGGRLGISDMCPEAETADLVNVLERRRDPTHRRALTEEEWRPLVAEAGLQVRAWRVSSEEVTFTQWMAPVAADGPEASAIRQALASAAEPLRSALTGGRPDAWVKRRLVFVAERR